MKASTQPLAGLLAALSAEARRVGLNDAQWADAAGVRKETLSRLRGRTSCDLATLAALAGAVGAALTVQPRASRGLSADGHLPARFEREYEDQLLALCASRDLTPGRWRTLGPAFFMAGLAVMLASAQGADRRNLLALAEALHPGSSLPEVFALWLRRSPLRPSRFLPMLAVRSADAA
jgi:hypothetical protein